MNREIKFRFWNKALWRMSAAYGLGLIWEHLCKEWGQFDWKDVEKLQYTGLKDRNVAEIYEGDIVELAHEYLVCAGETLGSIEWRQNGAWYINYGNSEQELAHVDIGHAGLYIIGNIRENPELAP